MLHMGTSCVFPTLTIVSITHVHIKVINTFNGLSEILAERYQNLA